MLQGLANQHTDGSVSELLRNRALGIADVAAPAVLAQRGEVKAASNGAAKSEPGRFERIDRRTQELRSQGVSTYAARDQATQEILAEERA